MPLVFPCEYCSQSLQIPENMAGRVFLCPRCRGRVTSPGTAPILVAKLLDEPPSTVSDQYHVDERVQRPSVLTEQQPEEKKPRKKPRKLTQDERLLADEVPWYVRHLHWLLLFALIPVITAQLSKQGEFDLEARIKATIERLSPEQQRDIDDEVDSELLGKGLGLESFLKGLPQRRLLGAWLPRDSSLHWLLAGAAGLFYLQFFIILSIRTTAKPWHLVLVALFTATLGIIVLEFIQILAMICSSPFMGGPALILLWPFKLIGMAYNAALDEGSSFMSCLMGFTFGVGLCEELVKLIPVFVYVKWIRKPNWHGAFLWGLSSGAGFGIAEAIMYSSNFYNGIAPGSIYFERFISCVALHAIWSGCVGITLYLLRDLLKKAGHWTAKVGVLFLVLLVPMLFHGFYDAFLVKEYHLGALIIALMTFGLLAMLDYWLHQPEVLSFLRTRNLAKV